jgi:hypothetical protein
LLSNLTSLLLRSAALVAMTTALFWAVVGAAAARRTGRRRGRGALIGGLLPVVGSCYLLRPVRTTTTAASTGPLPLPVPQPALAPPAASGWGQAASSPAGGSAGTWGAGTSSWSASTATPPAATAAGSWGSTAGAPAAWAPAPYEPAFELAPATSPVPDTGNGGGVLAMAAPLGLALTACVAVAASLAEPLIVIKAPVVGSQSVLGGSTGFTATPLFVMILALALASAASTRWPRGTWSVVGAGVGATAILIALQLLLVTHAAATVLATASHYTQRDATVDVGSGSYLLLLGGLLAFAWSCAAIAACPARPSTPAD